MAAVALGLYGVSLLVTFGLRCLQQYRRTGDIGVRSVTGRPGSWQWWAGLLMMLAVVLCVGGPVLQVIGLVAPLGVLDTLPVRVAGLVLAGLGIAATVAAQQTMGASWRIGVNQRERTDLVTGGVFRLVRNPIFTAMIIAVLGLTLLAPNLVAAAGLVALVVAVEAQVRAVEEPYLLAIHGQTYREYAARTGRFLPGLGRLPRTAALG